MTSVEGHHRARTEAQLRDRIDTLKREVDLVARQRDQVITENGHLQAEVERLRSGDAR